MSLTHAIVLFFAAMVAGAINAVAGGGSFVTFPTLLFMGVPPVNANATNTVALWPGQVASIGAYRRQFGGLSWKTITPLLVTGVLGGILGGWTLLKTPQTTFLRLVPWLILSATLIFMMSGRVTRWVRRRSASGEHHEFNTTRGVVFQTFIAFYIGYFGAGAGILILAMLLFVFSHAVRWPETVLMVVASMIGGYFGAHFAQKTKPEYVRAIVIVIGFTLTVYFFARQM